MCVCKEKQVTRHENVIIEKCCSLHMLDIFYWWLPRQASHCRSIVCIFSGKLVCSFVAWAFTCFGICNTQTRRISDPRVLIKTKVPAPSIRANLQQCVVCGRLMRHQGNRNLGGNAAFVWRIRGTLTAVMGHYTYSVNMVFYAFS